MEVRMLPWQLWVCFVAAAISCLIAGFDQGIVEYRFQKHWVGTRQARVSLAIYLGAHGLAGIVLSITSFAVLHPPSGKVGQDALYGISLGLAAEAFLRAQWPRSINQAGRFFSVIELVMERVMKIRGHRASKSIKALVNDMDDLDLGQLAMDLLHEHTIPKATESGKKELLREARANIDSLHGRKLGREADARAALRRTCRVIIYSEREVLSDREHVSAGEFI